MSALYQVTKRQEVEYCDRKIIRKDTDFIRVITMENEIWGSQLTIGCLGTSKPLKKVFKRFF